MRLPNWVDLLGFLALVALVVALTIATLMRFESWVWDDLVQFVMIMSFYAAGACCYHRWLVIQAKKRQLAELLKDNQELQTANARLCRRGTERSSPPKPAQES